MEEQTSPQVILLREKILQKISDHMTANNITQLEAANICGWKQQTVQRMLNGDFGPKLDNLLKLCIAVGLRLEIRSLMYKPTTDEG